MLAVQGLNAPGPLLQRPPQQLLFLRPMPVPALIRPAVQPAEAVQPPMVVQPAVQPAEAVQPPMVEVPAIQNARNRRGVRRRGKFTTLK